MDKAVQKQAMALLTENAIQPINGILRIVSARLTKTGAIVVLEDGRKLELFGKPKVTQEPQKMISPPAYHTLTVPKLKKIAKEKGIKGYSNFNKRELLNALEGASL